MGSGAAGIKNHDGTPLTDDLGTPPPGIGELVSASMSRLQPYPARRMLYAMAAEVIGVVVAFALFWGQRDPFSIACISFLVSAPMAAFIVVAFASLFSYRTRTFLGTDGVALVRGRRVRMVSFADIASMDSEVGLGGGQRGGPLNDLYCRLRITDRRRRVRVDVRASVGSSYAQSLGVADVDAVTAMFQRAPTSNGCHFIRHAADAWLDWQARRDAAA